MNNIEIITKEEITTGSMWPSILIVGIMAIILLIAAFKKNVDYFATTFAICFFIGVPILLLTLGFSNTLFPVGTGRYKYTAKVDETKVTIAEFREFMESYDDITYADGLYSFVDKSKES